MESLLKNKINILCKQQPVETGNEAKHTKTTQNTPSYSSE
jgi:hypothetical protein